jgi:hypothetical protein
VPAPLLAAARELLGEADELLGGEACELTGLVRAARLELGGTLGLLGMAEALDGLE